MRRILACVLFLTFTAPAFAAEPARRAINPMALKIPETRLLEIPLIEVIDYLRDLTDANIHVNWRAIEDIGIPRDTPISVDLRSVSLRQMLRLVLDQAAPDGAVTFYLEDGVIEVTTRELSDRKLITRVYPVDDLLMAVPDFFAPQIDISQTQTSGRGGGGGGQSIFTNGNNTQTREPQQQLTSIESGEQLVQLIQETIQPEIWRDNGGTASIRFFRNNLIVTAPRSVHEAIGGPLE